MAAEQREDPFRQVVRRIDPHGTLLRTWRPTGGVSAQVTALEFEGSAGHTTKLIVRRHGDADRGRNSRIARDEFKLLQIAHSHGLAVPKPYFFDESCELFPIPYVVVEYVEGETEFAPPDLAGYVAQAATQFAKIHRVTNTADLSFLPRQDKGFGNRPVVLDAALGEGRIRDALESAWPLIQVNKSVLLHGDFWPGNLLWNDGALVAVIDWEDAGIGDPLGDIANSRLEFLWSFGIEAMNELTNQYGSMTTVDFTNLPYWDLCAALRPCSKLSEWGLDDATEQRMREEHHRFVTQALDKLPNS